MSIKIMSAIFTLESWPTAKGIDKQETGYIKLDQFAKAAEGKDAY
jgi:hypothetical protein